MIFTIHQMREGTREERLESLRAVPESKSTMAAMFPLIWLVVHRLWLGVVVFFLLLFLFIGLLVTSYGIAAIAVAGLPTLYLYLEGNQILRNALERRGFAMVGVVDAHDAETAIRKYLAGLADETAVPPAPRSAQPRPVRTDQIGFGMFGES